MTTQTITAYDLIRRSMMLINAVAAGETPSDADLNDALLALNEMIDSQKLESLVGYQLAPETRTLTPGKSVYRWGTSVPPGNNDFLSEQPVWINGATCIRNGISTPVEIISQEDYALIPIKATPCPVVEKMVFIGGAANNATVILYPVPTEAVTLSINTATIISGPIDLQTEIALPPGYLRMYRYCLAVELWPEYTNPSTDIAAIKTIAKEALGKLKVAHIDTPYARFDDVPGVDGQYWDWRIA